jgi:aryl-phospho-beta-D-glucosidase BglC (GH1 family)
MEKWRMPSSNGFSSSGTLNNSVLGNSLNNSANLNSLNNAGVDPGLQVANAGSLTRAAASKWDDFEVVGSKIYDPDGREFIAKGVNINGPGFGWPGDTPNQVDNVKKWGFNSIRLNIRELGIEPKNRYAQNGTVDQIVRNFTKEGIVVMIDIHEKGGGWYNASELNKLISYSKDLGSKYKDNPYVWINVTNEPGGHDSGSQSAVNKYLNQYTKTIKAIRSTGFDNPIVVDGWFWGQDKGAWNSDPVKDSKSAILSLGPKVLASDPLKNTLFSFHAYDQWRFDTKNTMNNYIDRIHDKGLAVVVGEYGARSNGGSPANTLRDTVVGTLASTQQKEVGRFAWAWWGGDPFDLALGGKGGAFNAKFNANGSMPSNLTWYGQQVWKDNYRTESLQMRPGSGGNSSPKPDPAPLPAPTPSNPVTPPPVSAPASGGTIRYEAESLSLKGYQVESQLDASGGKRITLLNSGTRSGTASGTFNGTAGSYTVRVGFVDEWDGKSTATVKIGGQTANINFDQNYSGNKLIQKTLFSNLQLKPGDRFEIAGNANGDEWARIDWIEFIPNGSGSKAPTASPAPLPPNRKSIRFEAESLSLSGYQVELSSSASGGQQISLLNSGRSSGTASGVFNGASGTYSVKIKYLDETDGSGRGSVAIAGQSGSFSLNQTLSVDTAIEKIVLPTVQLTSGDRFDISGTANGYEWARIDWIEFTPV